MKKKVSKKSPKLQSKYLELFKNRFTKELPDDIADLKQPLWGKVVPSITTIYTDAYPQPEE